MDNGNFITLNNGESCAWGAIPNLSLSTFREAATLALAPAQYRARIGAFFKVQERLILVLLDGHGGIRVASTLVPETWESLTAVNPAWHHFECELAENGQKVIGHPALNPVRFCNAESVVGVQEFFIPEGEELHEVAVGPVHAGVIEPGHFRFQCLGEKVKHLEIALGYQHRGIENLLCGQLNTRTRHYLETSSGDTSVAQSWTFAMIIEGMCQIPVSDKITCERAVALELERLANHIGDLGALAGDVAYLPTASYCGRLRGEVLNLTACWCGNRFGRNLIAPGGLICPLTKSKREKLAGELRRISKEVFNALDLMFEAPSVLERFEGTGVVNEQQVRAIGAVGMTARASKVCRDTRKEFALKPYRDFHMASESSGDVLARARLRRQEIAESFRLLENWLKELASSTDATAVSGSILPKLPSESFAVAVTEAWRGELVHVALSDQTGGLASYKVVDPSFHNWFALALALRGTAISDFPICNKSFNLSYCGHDL